MTGRDDFLSAARSAADLLRKPAVAEPTVSLLEHYQREAWVGAGLDDEINVRIRDGGDHEAAEGPAALALSRAERAPGTIAAF